RSEERVPSVVQGVECPPDHPGGNVLSSKRAGLLGALVSQGGTERTDPVDGRTGPLLPPRGVALGRVPLALGPDESVLGLGQPAPGGCQILSQTQVGAGGVLLRLETVLPVGGLVGAVVADGEITVAGEALRVNGIAAGA